MIFIALSYAQQQLQTIGVLPTIGSEDIDAEELDMLTKNLRTVAANILPGNAFIVLTQETVMKRLGGSEEYLRVCREGEGCIPSLGKKAEVDYVARCNVVSRGNILRMDCELYNSKTGALIGPFNSYDENPSDVDELMAIMGKKAPDMFKKIPGATRAGPPSIVGGISGLESTVAGALDFETRYLVNLKTEPPGAALSFNGVPVAGCALSPCKVELPKGQVRIIAALEQYETADTMVSLVRNNQNLNIKLKPNFGVFEVKPAYSDGVGIDEQWDLTINGKAFSSLENRLEPNKYKVKLSHRCYEDINFEVGINKGSHEVFDMAKHINLKLGGLVLSTERDGEPSSEPVFVNGMEAGETPFSESVPLCADVELGWERVSANIRLKHKETVKHTQRMPDTEVIASPYRSPPYQASASKFKSMAFLWILPSIQYGIRFQRDDNIPDTSRITLASDFSVSSVMALQTKSFIIGMGINWGWTSFSPEIYLADREGKEPDKETSLYPKYSAYFAHLRWGSYPMYISGSFGKTFWTSPKEKHGIKLDFADYFWEIGLGGVGTSGMAGLSFEFYYGLYEMTVRDVLYGTEKDFWQGTLGFRFGLALFGLGML
ncbi:MAG: PEGA domain-containing protein [Fibromonadaceae bacterium]|nr:PEGA domain-containing protein [Fibromonadaceae bacterium]